MTSKRGRKIDMWSMVIVRTGRGAKISIGMKNGDRRAGHEDKNDESNGV